MNQDEARSLVLRLVGDIAPEADLGALRPDASLRDQLDIDSFDFLTFVTRLHESTGINVPESDYASVNSLNGCVAYLLSHKPNAH